MKKTAIIFFLLFAAMYAYPQKKKIAKAAVTKIEFEIFGRRGRTEFFISKDSAISTSRTENKFIQLNAAQWNALLRTVKPLNLSALHTLKSPTGQRDVDGALHCRFFIFTKNKKYESRFFDSGKPMKQLQALYDQVELIRNELNESGKVLSQ